MLIRKLYVDIGQRLLHSVEFFYEEGQQMRRPSARVLSILLSVAITFTTFNADFSVIGTIASDEAVEVSEEVSLDAVDADAEIEEEVLEEIPEVEEVVEEATVEEVAEEPVDETVEEPATEETVEEPAADETTEEPAAQETTEEPAAEEPVAEEPAAEDVAENVVEAEDTAETTDENADSNLATVTYVAGEGGTVSIPSETVDLNTEYTIAGSTATPNEGYEFVNWTMEEEVVCEEATIIPSVVSGDITYIANFKVLKDEIDQVEESNNIEKIVNVTYIATEGGNVSIDSESVNINDEELFEGAIATAEDGYVFKNWVDTNGNEVSSSTRFVPTDVTEDTTYTAVFEKEEMPAFTYHKTANDIFVSIDAPEGAFPKGTLVNVEAVNDNDIISTASDLVEEQTSEEVSVEKVLAVDITFTYEGKEIEPKVPISVTLTSSEIENADDAKVVHVDDNGNASIVGASVAGDTAEFSSDEFSVYAVVTTVNDTNSRLTVKFINGEEEIASIYVKQTDEMSDVLYDPGVGDIDENVIFLGWTTEKNYTADTEALSIDGVRSEIKNYEWNSVIDNVTIVTYYAILVKQYKVTYLDETGTALSQAYINIRADKVDAGQTYTVNQAYTPSDDEHNFQGWYVNAGQNNIIRKSGEAYTYNEGDIFINEDVITIIGDVTFSVNAPEGHWLIFEENGKGATYTAPQFVLAGDVTSEPDASRMIRNGYTFDGWYTGEPEEIGKTDPTGEEFEFGNELEEKTTIYAKWIPNDTASYTVLIWKQKTNHIWKEKNSRTTCRIENRCCLSMT